MYSPDSSITGMAVTGLTSPTYTLAEFRLADPLGIGHIVSSLGGTQTGASANSVSKPFTVSWYSPKVVKTLPAANPVTGLRGSIPNNQYRLIVRKGGDVASGVSATSVFRLNMDIPAGMETYSPAELKAALSFLGGLLTEEADDIVDSWVKGGA